MSKKSTHWAAVNRRPGETAESWARRNHAHHRTQWQQDKINRGEWLSPEDYARLKGRPGRALPEQKEVWARLQRDRVTPPAAPPSLTPVRADERLYTAALDGGGAALRAGGMAAASAVATEFWANGTDLDPLETGKRATIAALQGGARSVATWGVEEGLKHGAKQLGWELAEEATKSALRETGRQAVQQVARQTMAQAARGALRGNIIGQVAGLVVEQGVDTYHLMSGDIDGEEYGKRSAENVGGAMGGLAGAAAGAAVGSVVPVIGTVVGGLVGGVLGSLGASSALRGLLRLG